MNIDDIFDKVVTLNRIRIDEEMKKIQSKPKVDAESKIITGSFDIEIVPVNDDVMWFNKVILKPLLNRLDESKRVEAAYEILQLYIKRERINKKVRGLNNISHKFHNFNKPHRSYSKRIKAAETILKSLAPVERYQSKTPNQLALEVLLSQYIEEQKSLLNDDEADTSNFRSIVYGEFRVFDKTKFEKELRYILARYGVEKINLREIKDILPT